MYKYRPVRICWSQYRSRIMTFKFHLCGKIASIYLHSITSHLSLAPTSLILPVFQWSFLYATKRSSGLTREGLSKKYTLSLTQCVYVQMRDRVRERERESERERLGGVVWPIAPKFCSRHFDGGFDGVTKIVICNFFLDLQLTSSFW